LGLFDLGISRFSIVGCVVLMAATLSIAQDTKTDSQPVAHPANTSPPNASTGSPAKSSKSSSASPHSTASKSRRSRKSAAGRRSRGQQKIDPQRALEIQEALIREHYLNGKPTGVWNDATQQAMRRYQADNNWQSKTTPDARALIKLGLGPDHQHLLNPESAMTGQSQAATTVSTPASAPASEKQQR
jgi:peptidoglycan hydrolase-like protein with peptidoglycan-binding domain